jgi:hypothetical protein
MKNCFSWYSNIGWQLFSLRVLNTSFHALLGLRVSVQISAVILMSLPLYVTWSFSSSAFNILCLFCLLNVLTIVFCEEILSVLAILSLNSLLYVDGQIFLKIWEILWYYFIEYVFCTFNFPLFSVIYSCCLLAGPG